jgi:hypothetical protein
MKEFCVKLERAEEWPRYNLHFAPMQLSDEIVPPFRIHDPVEFEGKPEALAQF